MIETLAGLGLLAVGAWAFDKAACWALDHI
jgi:hypothetical protein